MTTQDTPRPPTGTISGLGITAVGIGLLALALCWIPGLGFWAIPAAAIGIIIAVIGYFVAKSGGDAGTILPIIGGLVAALVIIVLFFANGGSFAGMIHGFNHPDQAVPRNENSHTGSTVPGAQH